MTPRPSRVGGIHESDMLLVPDPSRFWIDPFTDEHDPLPDRERRRPDHQGGLLARSAFGRAAAESYLKFTGIADTINVGPEAEFFIFDEARFTTTSIRRGFYVNSEEGHWNSRPRRRRTIRTTAITSAPKKAMCRSRRSIR